MIELWYVRTADVATRELLASCRALLSRDERSRHDKFVFDKNRHEFLVTRALCRGVLARYVGIPPAALTFSSNPYGRPELDRTTDVVFNLTNTPSLVACAVTRGRAVGVDAEPLLRAPAVMEVAGSVFTDREQRMLRAASGEERERRAVSLWTLKEAYMKARGRGMSIPPADFELDLEGPRINLRLLAPLDDHDAARWHLTTREIEGHVVATCIDGTGQDRIEVIPRRADLGELLAVG